MQQTNRKLAVMAIGGNSLIKDKQHSEVKYQIEAVESTCKHVVDMIQAGWDVVVTHGNGPQVGFILRRNELAAGEVHTTPMDVIGADTQGAIGYMLQQALDNEMLARGINRRAYTVITQTLVDQNDPAYQNPSKPIGSFLDEAEGKRFADEGWTVVEDSGRGWRRVVPSPEPVEIVEEDAIRNGVRTGWIVIAVGGGGIPVIRNAQGKLEGVAAVIDKDLASSLLATRLHADLFLISTAVEQVMLHFGTPDEKAIDRMTSAEAKQYLAEGHFAPGSMKPKVEACLKFLEAGGAQALITDPAHLKGALDGETGTRIVHG